MYSWEELNLELTLNGGGKLYLLGKSAQHQTGQQGRTAVG